MFTFIRIKKFLYNSIVFKVNRKLSRILFEYYRFTFNIGLHIIGINEILIRNITYIYSYVIRKVYEVISGKYLIKKFIYLKEDDIYIKRPIVFSEKVLVILYMSLFISIFVLKSIIVISFWYNELFIYVYINTIVDFFRQWYIEIISRHFILNWGTNLMLGLYFWNEELLIWEEFDFEGSILDMSYRMDAYLNYNICVIYIWIYKNIMVTYVDLIYSIWYGLFDLFKDLIAIGWYTDIEMWIMLCKVSFDKTYIPLFLQCIYQLYLQFLESVYMLYEFVEDGYWYIEMQIKFLWYMEEGFIIKTNQESGELSYVSRFEWNMYILRIKYWYFLRELCIYLEHLFGLYGQYVYISLREWGIVIRNGVIIIIMCIVFVINGLLYIVKVFLQLLLELPCSVIWTVYNTMVLLLIKAPLYMLFILQKVYLWLTIGYWWLTIDISELFIFKTLVFGLHNIPQSLFIYAWINNMDERYILIFQCCVEMLYKILYDIIMWINKIGMVYADIFQEIPFKYVEMLDQWNQDYVSQMRWKEIKPEDVGPIKTYTEAQRAAYYEKTLKWHKQIWREVKNLSPEEISKPKIYVQIWVKTNEKYIVEAAEEAVEMKSKWFFYNLPIINQFDLRLKNGSSFLSKVYRDQLQIVITPIYDAIMGIIVIGLVNYYIYILVFAEPPKELIEVQTSAAMNPLTGFKQKLAELEKKLEKSVNYESYQERIDHWEIEGYEEVLKSDGKDDFKFNYIQAKLGNVFPYFYKNQYNIDFVFLNNPIQLRIKEGTKEVPYDFILDRSYFLQSKILNVRDEYKVQDEIKDSLSEYNIYKDFQLKRFIKEKAGWNQLDFVNRMQQHNFSKEKIKERQEFFKRNEKAKIPFKINLSYIYDQMDALFLLLCLVIIIIMFNLTVWEIDDKMFIIWLWPDYITDVLQKSDIGKYISDFMNLLEKGNYRNWEYDPMSEEGIRNPFKFFTDEDLYNYLKEVYNVDVGILDFTDMKDIYRLIKTSIKLELEELVKK